MKTIGLKILFIATVGISTLSAEMIRIDTKEVVIDTDRKLMWQDDDRKYGKDSKELQWHQAINYCDNLVFAGFGDWHLPSLSEANSIKGAYDNNSGETHSIIDNTFKSRLTGSWTATETIFSNENRNRMAMIAHYSNNQQRKESSGFKEWKVLVRCVRDMQSNESVDKASINESNRQETIKKEREAQLKKEQDEKAAKEAARKFVKLGNCEVGETVFHREAWDTSSSSGNILADSFFNASIKESFIIEFEGVVKGFVGKKVEVYLQDYSVKQTRGGGVLQPATGVGNSVINYADKRIGKSHFFDKSRCGN